MLTELLSVYPLEGCGLLAGQAGLVQKLYPINNRLASPTAFEMEPREQLLAMLDIDRRGWTLLAIYHSHPQGPERPSPTDLALITFPESWQVIVSLQDRRRPVVRAFAIQDGQVTPVPIEVV